MEEETFIITSSDNGRRNIYYYQFPIMEEETFIITSSL